MEGRRGPAAACGYRWWGSGQEPLDRALVAGLLLDTALAASPWPPDPQTQGRALKIRVQEALLDHLAGRITLDHFRDLLHTLERSFSFYFPLLLGLLPRPEKSPALSRAGTPTAPGVFPRSRTVAGDLLAAALGRLRNLLPHRPGGKLTGPKLQDFLSRSSGAWFRLRDFQEYFAVDRKTAWEYLQKFLHAGLLVHNRARATAVRYALADDFLRVRAGAVRREMAALLEDLPGPLAARVADRVIISGGEPFWEEELRRLLPAAAAPEVLVRLTRPESLLEAVCPGEGSPRLLRLQSPWLRAPGRDQGGKKVDFASV